MKNGFTLIELLAVIVMLAIIALVATPIILGIINDAKINSFKSSAHNIYSGVRDYFFIKKVQDNNLSIINLGVNDAHELEFNGKYPDAGIAIMDSNNKVGIYVYDNALKMCGVKNYSDSDFIFYDDVSKGVCESALAQPNYLQDIVAIGDYVDYDAGNWATTISYTSLNTNGAFGGYTAGTSKNQGLACESSVAIVDGRVGWRVVDINEETGVVSLVHAGTPECYYHSTDTVASITNLTTRDYSYYVNPNLASSATIFTTEMAGQITGSSVGYNSDLNSYNILLSGSRYFFPTVYNSTYLLYTQSGGWVGGQRYNAYGIRPVVRLNPNLYVGSGTGTSTDKYIIGTNYVAPVTTKKAGLITGYWQNWNSSDTVNLRLKNVSSNYDIVALAFGYTYTGSDKGSVNFTLDQYLPGYLDGYTDQDLKDDIKILQLRGQKVVLSIGGASNPIVVDDAASITNFVNSVYDLIQDYRFDGIDINFETGMSPIYLGEAIKQLASRVGDDFILTMAPQTVDFKVNSSGVASGNYYTLINEVKDLITIVNMQMYNSGTQYGLDGNIYSQGTVDFVTALTTILIEKGLEQSQVGIGSNYSSSNGGYMTPTIFVSAYKSLKNGDITVGGSYVIPHAYPNLGGFMIWSINGDTSLGNVFSSTYHEALPDE